MAQVNLSVLVPDGRTAETVRSDITTDDGGSSREIPIEGE
jgi:hypothetical protein